ncbi:MAG: VanZ family protein [Vicinamibacterales bacterium]
MSGHSQARPARVSPWLIAAVAVVALAGLMFVEDLGSGVLNQLLLYLPGVDKALHFVQSLAIFLVVEVVLRRTALTPMQRLFVAAGAALGAAVADEIQQQWAGGRSVEVADVAAGTAGILAGIAALLRRRQARLAAVLATVAVVMGARVTYDSYRFTRDYNHGLLAEQARRYDEAEAHYRRGVEADVPHPELYNALAWRILESGRGDAREAVRLAERSLQLYPGNADALDTYGWALREAGRASDAVAPLERALAMKPDIYCIHYHLGMTYLDLGRRDDGVRELHAQVDEMPDTVEARLASKALDAMASPTAEATGDRRGACGADAAGARAPRDEWNALLRPSRRRCSITTGSPAPRRPSTTNRTFASSPCGAGVS